MVICNQKQIIFSYDNSITVTYGLHPLVTLARQPLVKFFHLIAT